MIENFEIIDTGIDEEWTDYIYKFTLHSVTFYSVYSVSDSLAQIDIQYEYFKNFEETSKSVLFSNELKEQIKILILKQKEIRLRHLFKPYQIL